MLCCVALRCVALRCVVLYCIVLYRVMLCCVVLGYVVTHLCRGQRRQQLEASRSVQDLGLTG